MKPPAIGDIVHHVKRTQGSDGVWRSVCRAAIVTDTDSESTSLTVFHPDRIEHRHIVHNKHTGATDTWHHRTDCNQTPTTELDCVTTPMDLATRIGVDGDREYALILPGQILTGQFMYVGTQKNPMPYMVTEASNAVNMCTGNGDLPAGTGPTPTAAVLALILARAGYEAAGGIQAIGSRRDIPTTATGEVAPENRCTALRMDNNNDTGQCILPKGHPFHQYGDAP